MSDSLGSARLGQIRDTARAATVQQAALKTDQKQNLHVRGTSFAGRIVTWIKDHIFPSTVRTENIRILNMVETELKQALGVDQDTELTGASEVRPEIDSKSLPDVVLSRIEHFEGHALEARRDGEKFLSGISEKDGPGQDTSYLFSSAVSGAGKKDLDAVRKTLRHLLNRPEKQGHMVERYTNFMTRLSLDSQLGFVRRYGNADKHNPEHTTSVGASFTGFKTEFHQMALQAMLHNEVGGEDAIGSHSFEAGDLKTLNEKYKEYFS